MTLTADSHEERRRVARNAAGLTSGSLLLTCLEDVRWCCDFTGSNGWLLLGEEESCLLTDGRYVEQAALQVPPTVRVVACPTARSMSTAVATAAPEGPIAVQEAHLSVETWRSLSHETGERLVAAAPELGHVRRSKSSLEIDHIRRAAAIADEALAASMASIRRGTSERELRDELEAHMRSLGADGPSYETIVAGGPVHSALPHHRPTDRRFENGDTVVIDVGALVEGYHSDMTRTFFIGEPSSEVTRWYGVLDEAQRLAASMVAPGRAVAEIDRACRATLAAAELESWFIHGLGHGVGLLIHENPFINRVSEAVLRPGDVVTIEPGLYRGGFAGMRIEDLLLVTDDSHEILTRSPKDPTCPR